MHLRKRGKVWHGTFHIDGIAVERSTRTANRSKAWELLVKWQQEAADPASATSSTTLNDALSIVLDDRRAQVTSKGRSEQTVKFYEKKAGLLLSHFGHDFPIANFKDSSLVWKYIDARRATGVQDSTIEKETITLSVALKLAKERGRWAGDIDEVIPLSFRPEYVPKERSPTREEVLKLLPHLGAATAALTCFVLATGAEWASLGRVHPKDIPTDLDASDVRQAVKGSKNRNRNRRVIIVTDEQRVLLAYAARHAKGSEDQLFVQLNNVRRELAQGAKKAGIEHLSPHSLRRAAGQWLIDLGVPLEVVSRFMGHASTRITEQVYARIKDEDLADRAIDSMDPIYAQRARKARGAKARIKTITKLPPPRRGVKTYEVDGEQHTLGEWSKLTGISKSTLHHRVVEVGMTMKDALKLGKGQRGRMLVEKAQVTRSRPARGTAASDLLTLDAE